MTENRRRPAHTERRRRSAPLHPGHRSSRQVAEAVFGGVRSGFYFVIAAATALILFLAANTAFNGFPVLGSILAQDGYLPRQLHTRGDRLAFSNGIVLLAGRRDPADRRLRRRRRPG